MKANKFIPYLLAILAGVVIMAIVMLVDHGPKVEPGEYYWSTMLRNGYGWLAVILMVAAGCLFGYYFRKNPVRMGLCLIAVFPITAIVEATVYRGSHNMIPMELAAYFLWSLPPMAGGFLGRYLGARSE